MSTYLQQYLRTVDSAFEKVHTEFGIHTKQHSVYPDLVLFKYDQIKSPRSSNLVKECRGIILDRAKNWKIVAHPYNRFFNYGEGLADKLDWDSTLAYEKLDGSLITMYFYNYEWHVATSGVPCATGTLRYDYSRTFKDLFWETWEELEYEIPLETDTCFMFELCTSFNQGVVRHSKPRIVLHGCRNVELGTEVYPECYSDKYGWELAQVYSLDDISEVRSMVKKLNPLESEGVVLRDGNFNRVKFKNEKYVLLEHAGQTLNTRKMIKIIQEGEASEFLAYMPKFKKVYADTKRIYDEFVERGEAFYNGIKHLESQKEFALEAQNFKVPSLMFSLRKEEVCLVDFIRHTEPKRIQEWLGLPLEIGEI